MCTLPGIQVLLCCESVPSSISRNAVMDKDSKSFEQKRGKPHDPTRESLVRMPEDAIAGDATDWQWRRLPLVPSCSHSLGSLGHLSEYRSWLSPKLVKQQYPGSSGDCPGSWTWSIVPAHQQDYALHWDSAGASNSRRRSLGPPLSRNNRPLKSSVLADIQADQLEAKPTASARPA